MKCCFCNKDAGKWGNNPLPIMEGSCCDKCNNKIVIPFRIKSHFAFEQYKKDVLEAHGIKDEI